MKISAYSIIILGLAIGIVILSYGYFQVAAEFQGDPISARLRPVADHGNQQDAAGKRQV